MTVVLHVMQFLVWILFLPLSYSSPIVPAAPRAIVVDGVEDLSSEYDYVIIGGGTSGLVIANRLTEERNGMRQ